ncbi:hypothetical protein LguiA_005660 [Lonicera macranthoides]
MAATQLPPHYSIFTHKWSSLSISNPTLLYRTTPHYYSTPSLQSITQLKQSCDRRSLLLKCLSDPSKDAEPREETTSLPSDRGISAYSWCAGLGALGFIETGYLTYIKFTNSDAFCPIGGGTCGDILNSPYAIVFGVPLPLIGMLAYGLVATLGLQLDGKGLPFGIGESNARLALLGTTTSMATASAYFLFILSTRFAGASCSYCLASAVLSFGLLFTTLKGLGLQETLKWLGLQLFIVSLVVTALNMSYSTSQPASTSLIDTSQEAFTPEITTPSSPFALSLAKHLRSIGAKMYGAFWCSHCLEQKQMFGHEAAKFLDYVECFPNGGKDFFSMAKECRDIVTEGFPIWVIDGQVFPGKRPLSELAKLSGFEVEGTSQPS